MKRISLSLILLLTALSWSSIAMAQGDNSKERNRQQWFSEMRRYKADFIAKELDLTEEQKAKFVPLYEEMDAKTAQVGDEARKMEQDINKKGENVTETAYEKTAEALFEAKGKEAAIEMEYFNKFKTILTKKQLFKLKSAERKFTRKLMDHQRNQKNGPKKPDKRK